MRCSRKACSSHSKFSHQILYFKISNHTGVERVAGRRKRVGKGLLEPWSTQDWGSEVGLMGRDEKSKVSFHLSHMIACGWVWVMGMIF